MSALASSDFGSVPRYAAFELRIEGGAPRAFAAIDWPEFSFERYSKLKYGDYEATQHYGLALARLLMNRFSPEALRSSWVCASPYKIVPTTAASLLNVVLVHLARAGCAPLGVVKLDRRVLAFADYATMTAEERLKSTETRAVSVPMATTQQLLHAGSQRNKLIVLDDARIGGNTERATVKALSECGIYNVAYVYLTMLIGEADARVETAINSHSVTCLDDLIALFGPGHYLNARTCKRVLRGSPDEVARLVNAIPNKLDELISAIVADGYHLMPQAWPACHQLGIDVSSLSDPSTTA